MPGPTVEAAAQTYAQQELVARLVVGDEGDEDRGAVDRGAQLGEVLCDVARLGDRTRQQLAHGGQRVLPEVHELCVRDEGRTDLGGRIGDDAGELRAVVAEELRGEEELDLEVFERRIVHVRHDLDLRLVPVHYAHSLAPHSFFSCVAAMMPRMMRFMNIAMKVRRSFM